MTSFEVVLAVGEAGELGAHAPLGIVLEILAGLLEHVPAVLPDEIDGALNPEIDGANHRTQISVVLAGGADIGQHQLPHLVDVDIFLLDFDGGDAQALVEDLSCFAAERPGHAAADLRDVADADRESLEFTIDEEGLEKGVFRHMQAAAIRIVVDDNVTFVDRVEWDLLSAGFDQKRHAADHGWAKLRARDHVAFDVGERTGEVEALVENRRVRRLHQQDAHLAAERYHGGVDDVHRHHVHG